MKIIAGLGNPGKKFEKTRHNLGFRTLDEFKKKNDFPEFSLSKKFNLFLTKKKIGKERVVLIKPKTFMNQSGKAIVPFLKNLKIKTENLWVIHDDLDLPLGKIKISFGKGSAGHKGVQSIIDELKTKDFLRFRIGIGQNSKPKTQNFVLEKFTEKEEKVLKKVIKRTIEAIEFSLKEGVEKAMQKFNVG